MKFPSSVSLFEGALIIKIEWEERQNELKHDLTEMKDEANTHSLILVDWAFGKFEF